MLNNAEDIRLIDIIDNQVNYTVLVDRLEYCMAADSAVDDKQSFVFYVSNKDELVMLPVDKPQVCFIDDLFG